MRDLCVRIISTEMDLKLFTDRKYHNKIYDVIQSIREEYDVTENHAIACYRNCIRVYDSKRSLVVFKKF